MVNLTKVFTDLCDYWMVINNSISPYKIIAEGGVDLPSITHNIEVWETIKSYKNEK